MRFNLLDSVELLTDQRLVAVKQVSLAEEYLADHFPTFPVLPGVLMLEAMTQAAGWLLHHRSGFARSIAVLKEARNVKYGQFVAPGNGLRVDVEWTRGDASGGTFKAVGTVDGATALSGRLEIAYLSLADSSPDLATVDQKLRDHNRRRWNLLLTTSPRLNAPTPDIGLQATTKGH